MQINLEDVALAGFIQVYCMLAECLTIQSLEALDNASIKRLDERCQVWHKKLKLNMTWGVCYQVPREIVNKKIDESLLGTHLQI